MDCGDIDYVPGDLEQTFGNIEAAVRLLRSRGCLPVVLGGDHSISIPVARGLDQSGPFHVIQLDAHLDWTDQLGGNRLFNGHPMRYMSQLPYVDRMAHLGIHGIGSSKRSDFQDARPMGQRSSPPPDPGHGSPEGSGTAAPGRALLCHHRHRRFRLLHRRRHRLPYAGRPAL